MQRILVPTDFSAHALAAGRMAIALAARKGAEVMLFHGLPLFRTATVPPNVREAYENAELTAAERSIGEIKRGLHDAAGGAVEVGAVVREGDPASEILAYADEWGADLIAIGSRGSEGDDRLQFGSIAQRVSRAAPCPVLITRSGQESRAPENGLFRAPLIAIDYSKFSRPAAELAADISEPGSMVEMIHVYYAPDLGDHDDLVEYLGEERALELGRLEKFAANIDLAPLVVSVRTEVGPVAAKLLSYAQTSDTDVIILGAHGRDRQVELIGSVADKLLRVSPAPVIVIPDGAAMLSSTR